MKGYNRDTRLQIPVNKKELQAIDDWRFTQRMASRAAAIREAIRRGLAADDVTLPYRRKSADYGILDGEDGDGQAND